MQTTHKRMRIGELNREIKFVAEVYGWGMDVARAKMARAALLLGLLGQADAMSRVAKFLHGELPGQVICDGCRVRVPGRHRCQKKEAKVLGQPAGKACQCPLCFVTDKLGF